MASKREYSMFSYNESASITQRADKAVVLDISDESKSLMEQMKDLKKEQEESFKNLQVNVGVLSSRASKVEQTKQLEDYKDEAEMKLELLRRILESLRRGKGNRASLLKKMKSIEFPDKSAKGIGPTSVKGLSSPASIISDDGFDLSAYDKDGNGWIDEADDIFDDLKVWTKDEQGNDKLIALSKSGVGVIFLGNADTKFSLNDTENNKNAVIQRTGVYLKESGEVGTMMHVDMVV